MFNWISFLLHDRTGTKLLNVRGEMENIMTDKEAYELIGNRAKELIQNIEVKQKKWLKLQRQKVKTKQKNGYI